MTRFAALLVVGAALLALGTSGCGRKDRDEIPKSQQLAARARPEKISLPTLSLLRSQFEEHKRQWSLTLHGPDSPLPEDKVESFPGPEFYSYDPNWRFVGPIERADSPRLIGMPDTKGRTQPYIEYAHYTFERDGNLYSLLVYRPFEHPEQLFIPFRDSTDGQGSYEGGRYVHLDSLEETRFVLDFNKSYTPYCAYDENYACPLAPPENHLPLRIEAGMKYTPVP